MPDAPVMMLPAATGAVGVTAPRVMAKVSVPSTTVSPTMLTVIVLVSPAVPVKDSGLVVTIAIPFALDPESRPDSDDMEGVA